ncbi:type VI secretion system transmembrane protein TssQ [Bacteroides sp.]
MKAINHTLVFKGYMTFSVCMALVVSLFMLMSYCFISTLMYESAKIETRAMVFDKVFSTQVAVVDRVDSLYNYMALINSSHKVNDVMIQNVASTKKMQLLDDIGNMNEKDVLLYKGLVTNVNKFLSVKDSIRILKNQEETLKEDLQRCIASEQQASRKLSLESVQSAKVNGNGN